MATTDRNPDDEIPPEGLSALLEANRRFYLAFEAGDLDAMSDVWEHGDHVTCVHPGWRALRGWGAIAASWVRLFAGPERLQFILTDVVARIEGSIGLVTLDEDILGQSSGSTVAALNVFVRRNGQWRLVAHHGSGVVERSSSS